MYHKFTIVSPGRKGLDETVPQDSYHSYSPLHLIVDLKAELKNSSLSDQLKQSVVDDFKGADRAYLVEDFNAYMDRISNISEDAAQWFMSTKPDHWSNARFMGARYDHLSIDIVDPPCRWISIKDESSAVQIMHVLLLKTMDIIHSRQRAPSTLDSTLTPSLEQKLQKEMSRSRTLSTETMFEVHSSTVYLVNIGSWDGAYMQKVANYRLAMHACRCSLQSCR